MSRKGQRIGKWTLLEQLGQGGNGSVYRASDGAAEVALKLLLNSRPKRYQRFRDEVEVLRHLGNRPGVLPIIDAHLPEVPTKEDPAWLATPVATPLRDYLADADQSSIIAVCADLAESLAGLAVEGVHHRDVKPENLFWFEEKPTLGDFGLAQFPGKGQITVPGERLGPLYYMAPEMLGEADTADAGAADVYSMAKTLWVLASGQTYPPPGEVRIDVTALRLSAYVSCSRVAQLELLVERATRHLPVDRPSMVEFALELRAWLTPLIRKDDQVDLSDVIQRIEQAGESGSRYAERLALDVSQAEEVLQQLCDGAVALTDEIEALGRGDGSWPQHPNLEGYKFPRGIGRPPVIWHSDVPTFAEIPGQWPVHFCIAFGAQLSQDRRVRIFAAYQIGRSRGRLNVHWEHVWSNSKVAPLGSAELEHDINDLVQEATDQLRPALHRLADLVEQISSR